MPKYFVLTLLAVSPLLAGASCQTKPNTVVGPPVHTVTTTVRYVPIDAALTQPCPIEPASSLADAPLVAAKRKAALETCNGQLDAIRAIQGTNRD